MEVDIHVVETMSDLLEKTKPQMEGAIREVQLSTLMASSKQLLYHKGSKFLIKIRYMLKNMHG